MSFSCSLLARRLAMLAVALLAAGCETVAPYEPPVQTIRIDPEVASRWASVPPLDPRILPVEVVGPIVNHAAALVLVRRRVPANVPAPCPALADEAVLAMPEERWLFGLRTWDGREVLPCHYGLVIGGTGFYRYPDTDHDTWLPAEWVSTFEASGRHYVEVNTRWSAWFEGMPLGVSLEPGLPRAQARLHYHSVPYDQGVHVGERKWAWNLSGEGTSAYGIDGSDLYAGFLRHNDGVLFAARRNGVPVEVWHLDTKTLATKQLVDARYVFAWPPPPALDWQGRMEFDQRGAGTKVKAYVTRAAPSDPSLLWVRRPNGEFTPPPGTAGVVPLVTHASWYSSITKISGVPGNEERLVPVRHAPRTEQFLVAYDRPEGRVWGTASFDFATISEPYLAQVLLRPSPALSSRIAYDEKMLGTCQWVLAQRASDGAWAIGYGRVPEADAFRVGSNPDDLVAAAERRVIAEHEPMVANAKLARVINEMVAAQRAAEAKRRAMEARADAQRRYDHAIAIGSNFHGWSAALELGGEPLLLFLVKLGTIAQCEQVLARGYHGDAEEKILRDQIAFLRQKQAAEQAALQAAAAARSSGGGAGGGGIDWSGWRRETMNAQSANQLGLTGEAYSQYMLRHR
jgi:hypothetical protein